MSEFLKDRIEDASRLIRWSLATNDNLKRMAMIVGGFREVEQSVFVQLIEKPPPDSVSFSTAIVNQTRWMVHKMYDKRKRLVKGDIPKARAAYVINLSSDLEKEEMRKSIDLAFESLNTRDVKIIKSRMEGKTFESIGRDHKISKERVRQIEAKIIRKLQQPDVACNLIGHFEQQ